MWLWRRWLRLSLSSVLGLCAITMQPTLTPAAPGDLYIDRDLYSQPWGGLRRRKAKAAYSLDGRRSVCLGRGPINRPRRWRTRQKFFHQMNRFYYSIETEQKFNAQKIGRPNSMRSSRSAKPREIEASGDCEYTAHADCNLSPIWEWFDSKFNYWFNDSMLIEVDSNWLFGSEMNPSWVQFEFHSKLN